MKWFIPVLILVLSSLIFPKKLADLPEVMKNPTIGIYGDRIFIKEHFTIHIYSLKDVKHLKQFGKEGAGPSEFKFRAEMEVFPDKLVVNTLAKQVIFSHDGKFIKEYRITPFIINFLPVGKNFIGSNAGKEGQKINLYDENLKNPKTIYEGTLGQIVYYHSGTKGKQDMLLLRDYVYHNVYKDRIYIGDTTKGFFFMVFDSKGNKLYEVSKKYKKIKITKEFKEMMLQRQRESPGWKKWEKMFNYIFPEYFPAFDNILISDNKMYFITQAPGNERNQVIVTDLKGKTLRECLIPSGFYEGFHTYCAYRDRLYYIVENEDEEMWELHVEDLK